MRRNQSKFFFYILLLIFTIGFTNIAAAQQKPAATVPAAKVQATTVNQFTVKTGTLKSLLAVHAPPSGGPGPDKVPLKTQHR